MKGFLVINHFLRGEKFDTLHSHLIEAAKKQNTDLVIRTNQQMLFECEKPDFVLFWDKDINLARQLEGRGLALFNSSQAIELCDDKAKTYIALDGRVKQPKTIIAPLSFYESNYSDFVNCAVEVLGLPLVFKECFGSFGEQVFLCRTVNEILSHISSKPFLLQEYIECSGSDVRLEIVGGKCVAAMKRNNPCDFRSNISNGGTAEPYSPTQEEIRTAITACDILGLDFGGVDILRDCTVCEVNSNAHIINIMNCSGTDIAPYIFERIKEKL